jgi:hypothetical protein
MELSRAIIGYAGIPISDSEKRTQAPARTVEHRHSKYAFDEINAYIAIRNNLLAEAEEAPTTATLHRASIANDVVETFLKPARAPYGAQHLPEIDATRERDCCETVKARIRKLDARVTSTASQRAA